MQDGLIIEDRPGHRHLKAQAAKAALVGASES